MAFVTLMLVVGAVYLVAGDFFGGSTAGSFHAFVQVPPDASVGFETRLVLTVRNESDGFITLDEFRFPKRLLDSAPVVSIVPGTLNHTDYPDEIGYQIGYLLAPGALGEFEVTLLPQIADDVIGDIKVVSAGGERQAATGFRIVFRELPVVANVQTEPPQPIIEQTLPPTETSVPPTVSPTPFSIPYGAVVKITARLKHSSYLRDAWMGSGTIISPDGLIITNAHLVSPGQNFRPDVWQISITDDAAVPPTDLYFADPLVVDEDLDLAVFRITTDLRYRPVDPFALNLDYVPLGDSSQLKLGDPLLILGYPGIGGNTITLTRGEVGGFTLIGQYQEPAFIKTSAAISGGTSGGMAVDSSGHLVAIPTQLGYGQREGEIVDCRVIADTNLDGRVNQFDICVPVGGFINALRPINLALPLIDEARRIISSGTSPDPLITTTP